MILLARRKRMAVRRKHKGTKGRRKRTDFYQVLYEKRDWDWE
jgi:hypothetical protein